MAATSNTTLLSDLLDPQVVADEIQKKLTDNIRFAPLAQIDTTLVGRDGDELTFPYYQYIGDSDTVNEGADIPIAKLEQGKKRVKVSKIGKGVQYTDEALLSGNANNIAQESVRQITTSIAAGVDNKLLVAMKGATLTTAGIPVSGNVANAIIDGVAQFGEDMDGDKVLVVPSTLFSRIVKSNEWIQNTETGADIIIKGSIGQIAGCSVVVSDRLIHQTGDKYAFIVKPGALRIVMKRSILVDFDRDVVDQTNYVIGSSIFAPYLYDESKIVKMPILSE